MRSSVGEHRTTVFVTRDAAGACHIVAIDEPRVERPFHGVDDRHAPGIDNVVEDGSPSTGSMLALDLLVGLGQGAGILELQREARNAPAERIWPSRVRERYDLVSVVQQAVGYVATRIAERARNRVNFFTRWTWHISEADRAA